MTSPEPEPPVHSSDPTGLALVAPPVTLKKLARSQSPDTSGVSALEGPHKAQNALSEAEMLAYIQQEESGGNPTAQNPRSSAYGLYGFLDSTWRTVGCTKTPDPREQERCAILYMKQRYGSIEGAYKHHVQNNYY